MEPASQPARANHVAWTEYYPSKALTSNFNNKITELILHIVQELRFGHLGLIVLHSHESVWRNIFGLTAFASQL